MLIPSFIAFALLQASGQAPGYANAVVAGETKGGQDVVVIAGRHDGFPIPGLDWDDVVLKVGNKGYRYTNTDPKPHLTLAVKNSGGAYSVELAKTASMAAFDLTAKGPVAKGTAHVTIAFQIGAVPNLPASVLDFARKVDEGATLMILATYRLGGGTGSITIDGTKHELKSESLSGHLEETGNSTLNRSGSKNVLLVYDYAAGVKPYNTKGSPVYANGRLFATADGASGGGVPISIPVPLGGSLDSIMVKRTLLVSKVPIGPFVLERRLVTFRTLAEDKDVYQGLKEVWTWRGWPVSKNGGKQYAIPNIPGFPLHGETEAVTLGDRIVTIGGIAQGTTNRVTAYNPATGDWSRLAPLPFPLHHTAAVSNGADKIWVMGGASKFWYQIPPFDHRDDLLIYDAKKNSWTKGPKMPEPRLGHDAVWYQGKIYVMGGESPDHHEAAEVLIYDPSAKTWKKGATIPTNRHHAAAFVHENRIHVVGGRSDAKHLKTVEIYDPKTDSWSKAPDFPVFFNGGNVLALGGKIYAFGGEGPQPEWQPIHWVANKTIYVMNSATKTWSSAGQMIFPRHGMGAVKLGGRAWLVGGTSGGGMMSPLTPTRTVEWFAP